MISFKTSGRKSAIRISVFAARDGSRRPCSHCSSVRFETPINAANWLWERPVLIRALVTSVFGSTTTFLPPLGSNEGCVNQRAGFLRYAVQSRCHRFPASLSGGCFLTLLYHVWSPSLRWHYPPSSVLLNRPTPCAIFAFLPLQLTGILPLQEEDTVSPRDAGDRREQAVDHPGRADGVNFTFSK